MYCRDIDSTNEYMLTPLHYAAMKSNISAVQALTKYKANVNAQDVNQMTPLLLACVHGSKEVIQKLIKAGSDITQRDQRLNTAFHIVALRGEKDYLKMMMEHDPKEAIIALNKVNNEGKTPLRMAVEGNHPETLTEILEMEKKNSQKWTARETELIHFASRKGYLQVLKALVEAGGDKNEVSTQKSLPLHVAAEMNQKAVVEYLLEESNMEAQDDYGMTPLMLAVTHDSIECVQFLIERGANYFATDNDERTLVFVGAKFNALKSVEYILKFLEELKTTGSCDSERDPLKQSMSSRKTLRNLHDNDKSAMVNMTDRDQNSPMHVVASTGYLEMMTVRKIEKNQEN